jgi:hypothetical protein
VILVTSSPDDFPPIENTQETNAIERTAMPFGLFFDNQTMYAQDDDDMIAENAAAAATLPKEGDIDMFSETPSTRTLTLDILAEADTLPDTTTTQHNDQHAMS